MFRTVLDINESGSEALRPEYPCLENAKYVKYRMEGTLRLRCHPETSCTRCLRMRPPVGQSQKSWLRQTSGTPLQSLNLTLFINLRPGLLTTCFTSIIRLCLQWVTCQSRQVQFCSFGDMLSGVRPDIILRKPLSSIVKLSKVAPH